MVDTNKYEVKGFAKLSKSQKALNLFLNGQWFNIPVRDVKAVLDGDYDVAIIRQYVNNAEKQKVE